MRVRNKPLVYDQLHYLSDGSNNVCVLLFNPLKCGDVRLHLSVQCHPGLTYIFSFTSGSLALMAVRMSEIKNVG